MYTLGINAVYHDSAACLVRDGRVIAAAEEERFTRVKHAKRPVPFSTYELPFHAIDFCLARAGITLAELDHVAYSYDPHQLLPRSAGARISLPLEPSAAGGEAPWQDLMLSYVVNAPRQLADGAPHYLRRRIHATVGTEPYAWHFVDHHLAHEASAFLPSPYTQAAVLTMDGRGEHAATTYAMGDDCQLRRLLQIDEPHSLGLLYEEVTRYLGFLHASDEYKVMALAAYGQPRYVTEFRRILVAEMDGRYTIQAPELEARFGRPRQLDEALTQHHFDIASSVQTALEDTVLDMSQWLYAATGAKKLCLAGGVALNCVMNGRLRREGPFQDIWVQPAAGDAGTALGAALWVDARQRPNCPRAYVMDHAYLGPTFSDADIEALLQWSALPYRRSNDVAGEAAELLARDKVIGWFQGGMEFGPRALGGRSILASPSDAQMAARLNEIKGREEFRPVAPVVLEEEAPHWFVDCERSPFMLFAYTAVPDKAALIPAALHVDGTGRVQTVNAAQNPLYHDVLRRFFALTGVPVLVNTSFNTRGEPMVCSPRDALQCFWTSPLDALVIGPFVLEKPEAAYAASNGHHSHLQTSATA